MLTVATLFWQANGKSRTFSRMYDETWVEKLYRGFSRNLTMPFQLVCYTDRDRVFSEPIKQKVIPTLGRRGYSDCIMPYEMGVPMILVGLDTVVTGNCDELAEYCFKGKKLALPRDPYRPFMACNGVALVPAGHERIALTHQGQNDMAWVRKFPHLYIDDRFPAAVQSFKGSVKDSGIGDCRIVYFHGEGKPHQLPDGHPILEHWI